MQSEPLIFVIVKALLELAAFLLFGQVVLYMVLGPDAEASRIYRVFRALASPLVSLTRRVTPGYVGDRHIPYLAILLLIWAWLIVVYWLLPEACRAGIFDCAPLFGEKGQV